MAVHTEAGVFQRYTGTEHGAGDVTNNAFLYALMSVARGQQTGYDDADADWLLLGYEVTLTADGTFKLATCRSLMCKNKSDCGAGGFASSGTGTPARK